MEILWEVEIDTGNKRAIWRDCIFKNDTIYFVFGDYYQSKEKNTNEINNKFVKYIYHENYGINVLKINPLTGEYTKIISKCLLESGIISPDYCEWKLFINSNDIILFVGKDFIIISENDIAVLPDSYLQSINDETRNEIENDKDIPRRWRQPREYCFEDYIVTYNGATTIKCINKNNKHELWKQFVKKNSWGKDSVVSMVTEIEYKNGHIIFITHSYRSYCLYCIEISTGIVKTVLEFLDDKYVWDNDTIFIKYHDKLLQLNPFENKILQEIESIGGGMYNWESPLKIFNDNIFTVKHEENKEILLCIKK
jgi:hypothetical protein